MLSKEVVTGRLLDDLDVAQNDWFRTCIIPFTNAYNGAWNDYHATLDRAAAARQRRQELFFVAISIAGGTALTAMFGKAALKTAAKEMTVQVICNNNLEKAFNVAASLEASPVASFAIGAAFDASVKIMSTEIKRELQSQLPAEGAIAAGDNYFVAKGKMEKALADTRARASHYVQFLRDSSDGLVSDELANILCQHVRDGALMSPPDTSPYPTDLAKGIELMFYLNLIMSRDFLATGHWETQREANDRFARRSPIQAMSGQRGRPQKTDTKIQSIGAAPGSTEYPSSRNWRQNGRRHYEAVRVSGVSNEVARATNQLHRTLVGGDLMDLGWFDSGIAQILEMSEVRKAHNSFKRIANNYSAVSAS